MTAELQAKLFKKYPKIFGQRKKSMRETAMCWGIETGPGWFWLIDNLCASIQGYIDANPQNCSFQVQATQVKEKYGTLRFYWGAYPKKKHSHKVSDKDNDDAYELITGMVWLAEHMSGHICERCGSHEGRTIEGGWVVTLCPTCEKKEEK